MRNKKLASFLILLPILFLVLGLSFDRTQYGTDPESAYLINGLNIAMFKPVGLFHHPGAPVQIYSALMLKATHFIRFSGTDLQTDVLSNSEFYIEVLRKGLIALNAILILLTGLAALLFLKNIWLALIVQITPFLSATVIELAFTKVSPEPMILATVMMIVVLTLKYYTSQSQKSKWFPFAFAVLCGFGLANRITFLPMLIIPFLIVRGNWNKLLFLFVVIPSFVLFTLPLLPVYKSMYYWFRDIGTHTGAYGQGDTGLINTDHYLNSVSALVKENVLFASVMIISFVLLLVIIIIPRLKKQPEQRREPIYILAFLLAQAGSAVLVAKQYSSHYLIGALCLTGIIIVFILLYFNTLFVEKSRNRFTLSYPLITVLLIVIAMLNKPYLTLAYQGYRLSNKSTTETMANIDRDYPGYVKTYYYPVSFNEYSQLRWGNVYAQRIHTDALVKLFPEGLFFNVWEKSFQLWETSISPVEFLNKYGGRILLIGGPRSSEELKMVEQSGLKLRKLSEGRVQVVYEVDTAHSALFQDVLHPGEISFVLKNDFESISPDKQWIMVEGERFCKNTALSTERPRSGKNSLYLPVKDSYAMEYELVSPDPGRRYQVSIWRYGAGENAYLVVSAKNAKVFYNTSKVAVETDAAGWSKISINFRVPDGFAQGKLKVYLWNTGNSPAWFDDFEIIRYK